MHLRRKRVAKKPDVVPSTQWHVMHDSFYPLFKPECRERVESWYNIEATGTQRELFRSICSHIYAVDLFRDNAEMDTGSTAQTAADLLVKNYGDALSEEGKAKAHAWLRCAGKSRRSHDQFRDVFMSCQAAQKLLSVCHAEYGVIEPQHYVVDRTHFIRHMGGAAVRGCTPKPPNAQGERADDTDAHRVHPTATERNTAVTAAASTVNNTASTASKCAEAKATGCAAGRVTKPRNQFDGVNYLAALGYGGVDTQTAIDTLRRKREAYEEKKRYYVNTDGSTVYRACNVVLGPNKDNASGGDGDSSPNSQDGKHRSTGGILASVSCDPVREWKVKTLN